MNRILGVLICTSLFLSSTANTFADLNYIGTFSRDDEVQQFPFTLNSGSATLLSYSYAGGTNTASTPISAGGFDIVLGLYRANGAFLGELDDYAGAPLDPVTTNPYDSRIIGGVDTVALTPGNYIAVVTQFDNILAPPRTNLSNGFNQTLLNRPDFTGVDFGPGPGNMFYDNTAAARTSSFAFDIIGDVSVGPNLVPEPTTFVLAVMGLLSLISLASRRRKR